MNKKDIELLAEQYVEMVNTPSEMNFKERIQNLHPGDMVTTVDGVEYQVEEVRGPDEIWVSNKEGKDVSITIKDIGSVSRFPPIKNEETDPVKTREALKAQYDKLPEPKEDWNTYKRKHAAGKVKIEEHHGEDWPEEVLSMSVGELLDELKKQGRTESGLYEDIEDFIQVHFIDFPPEGRFRNMEEASRCPVTGKMRKKRKGY